MAQHKAQHTVQKHGKHGSGALATRALVTRVCRAMADPETKKSMIRSTRTSKRKSSFPSFPSFLSFFSIFLFSFFFFLLSLLSFFFFLVGEGVSHSQGRAQWFGCGPSTAFLANQAPVCCGCPARTHGCDLVTRMRRDQSANPVGVWLGRSVRR